MMLRSIMKNYLNKQKFSGEDIFGLVVEHVDEVPLSAEESTWEIVADPERLTRKFDFEDIERRNWFLKELLEDEVQSGHNGRILADGMDVVVEVWTHDLDAVTELDLEYASRCDDIFNDVSLLGDAGYGYR